MNSVASRSSNVSQNEHLKISDSESNLNDNNNSNNNSKHGINGNNGKNSSERNKSSTNDNNINSSEKKRKLVVTSNNNEIDDNIYSEFIIKDSKVNIIFLHITYFLKYATAAAAGLALYLFPNYFQYSTVIIVVTCVN
eukprot:Awhi_evm2s15034